MFKAATALAALVMCVSSAPPQLYRADGPITVVFVPTSKVETACGITAPEGMVLRACARSYPWGQRYIVMPDPCEYLDQPYAEWQCHENAHALGGWPGDHPL